MEIPLVNSFGFPRLLEHLMVEFRWDPLEKI